MKTNILCIFLALILIFGILSLPYEFDLSIGNNVSDKNEDDESDTPSDGVITDEEEVRPNPGTPGDDTLGPVVTLRHEDLTSCPTCFIPCTYNYENYGSIGGWYYEIFCLQCDYHDSSGCSVTHEYSNKDGVCTALNCYHKCTHDFTWEAIEYVLPVDERFSMFDVSTLEYGDSAVYNGICTICQKTITD